MATKKHVRPTLAQMRELEARLEDQIEGTSRLVRDCDLWRDKYIVLKACYDFRKMVQDELLENVIKKKEEISLMKEKQCVLQAKLELLEKESKQHAAEVELLKNRGFWARLLNK